MLFLCSTETPCPLQLVPVTRIAKTVRTDGASEEGTINGSESEDRTANNKTSDGEYRPGRDNLARLWPLPGIFPSDTFYFGRSISNRPQTVAEQVRPRWFCHDLSGASDSGIGYSGNVRTRDEGVGRAGQNTFQPTLPQPTRRKRRASGRVVTVSDVDLEVRIDEARWGMPRKRALFSPEGQDSVSSASDVVDAQSGWPLDDEFPREARSPWVDLADAVACLQKEVEEFRAESGYGRCSSPEHEQFIQRLLGERASRAAVVTGA